MVRAFKQWPGAKSFPGSEVESAPDGYKRTIVNSSLAKTVGKPRLMLTGTELIVKSRAQVCVLSEMWMSRMRVT